MSGDLPPLAEFLRWLADLPAACRDADGRTPIPAVVADLWETLYDQPAPPKLLAAFHRAGSRQAELNRRRWVLAACRLLWHPALRGRPLPAVSLAYFLTEELAALAEVAPAERLANDEERREELIRRAFAALGLRLPSESDREAEDRLTQVNSVERQRLLREAAERERRAREVREAMERRAAAEAAARYSPE